MTHSNPEKLGSDSWDDVRRAAAVTLPGVRGVLGDRNGLVPVNWRAHAAWFATTHVHDGLTPPERGSFRRGLVEAASEEQAVGPVGRNRAARFFNSRIDGYDEALEASRQVGEITPIVNYLVACCSTPRVEIRFDDVRASPVCVQAVARRMSLDVKTRRRLEEQVAEPKFAFFLPDLGRDLGLEKAMHEVSALVAEGIELARARTADARAS